jgi:hypothetical protein
MRLRFTHSHAFDGCRLSLSDPEHPGTEVEFADGTVVLADCQPTGEGGAWMLELPAYRTGKGTAVGAARWRLARDARGDWRARRAG